jgi:hypothetical protein
LGEGDDPVDRSPLERHRVEPLRVALHPKKNRYARDRRQEKNQQHNFHLGSNLGEQLSSIANSAVVMPDPNTLGERASGPCAEF